MQNRERIEQNVMSDTHARPSFLIIFFNF